jgi:hypothetical protein
MAQSAGTYLGEMSSKILSHSLRIVLSLAKARYAVIAPASKKSVKITKCQNKKGTGDGQMANGD